MATTDYYKEGVAMIGLTLDEKLAVHFEVNRMIDTYGKQSVVATKLGSSQQNVSRVARWPEVSDKFANNLAKLMKTTLDDLIAKYRNDIDLWKHTHPEMVTDQPAQIEISANVRELASVHGWLPLTQHQLELWMRAQGGNVDPEELKAVGEDYDRTTRISNDRVELRKLRGTQVR